MKKIATILCLLILVCIMSIPNYIYNKDRETKIDAGVTTQESNEIAILTKESLVYLPVVTNDTKELYSRDNTYMVTPTPIPVLKEAIVSKPTIETSQNIKSKETKNIPTETTAIENGTPYYKQCGLSEEDFEFFARVVAAEDNGNHKNDYDNQVAIAQVVWNRVDSPNWPNTVRKVLTEHGQFATVRNGNCHTKTNDNCRKAIVDAYLNRPHPANIIYFRSGYFFHNLKKYMQISDNYFSYE